MLCHYSAKNPLLVILASAPSTASTTICIYCPLCEVHSRGYSLKTFTIGNFDNREVQKAARASSFVYLIAHLIAHRRGVVR